MLTIVLTQLTYKAMGLETPREELERRQKSGTTRY